MTTSYIVIEVSGEGKTDLGVRPATAKRGPEPPTVGVVPILAYKLCGSPESMRVIRHRDIMLMGGSLGKKVTFAKRRAAYNKSHGVIFVVDTEGPKIKSIIKELADARNEKHHDMPTAVGVAHPCIEAWLLTDAAAIQIAMSLATPPELPTDPEGLPAPQKDRSHNPKTVLAQCCGLEGHVSASQAARIAMAIDDISVVETGCPQGFGYFAGEVRTRLLPLFQATSDASE